MKLKIYHPKPKRKPAPKRARVQTQEERIEELERENKDLKHENKILWLRVRIAQDMEDLIRQTVKGNLKLGDFFRKQNALKKKLAKINSMLDKAGV